MKSEKLVKIDDGKSAATLSKQAILDRINFLSEEIDANEAERIK